MWVRITPPERKATFKQWMDWLKNIILWRIYAFKRAVKEPIKWLKRRKRIREINKRVKLACEESKRSPKYEPPTPEEVKVFMKWAANSGIAFDHRISPMPKSPRNSMEVDITNTGIHHGN
jgi:hypothetical protein